MKVALKTAHGTYLRAGDLGEVNQATNQGEWEEFELIEIGGGAPPPPPPPNQFQWQGDFLYPHYWFFGPACVSLEPGLQRSYFNETRGFGHTHVLINADQADWGPSKGPPEWTHGGFSVYERDSTMLNSAKLTQLFETLARARAAGLSPVIGVVDQPTLRAHNFDFILQRSRNLAGVLQNEGVRTYMLSWEIDEVYGTGDDRIRMERDIERWVKDVDWYGADVGIHHADGLRGGNTFYSKMTPRTVRFMQYPAGDSLQELAHKTRLVLEVAENTNTKLCVFEHSSPLNQNPTYPADQARIRRDACMNEVMKSVSDGRISLDRVGYLN